MPTFERDGVSLYYEEFGSGYPLLLFAPGGMRSAIDFWHRSPFDPTREFATDFRVIAMDQRNAGRFSPLIPIGFCSTAALTRVGAALIRLRQ